MQKKKSKKTKVIKNKTVTLSISTVDYKELTKKAKAAGKSVKNYIMQQVIQTPELKIIPCVEMSLDMNETSASEALPSVSKDSVIEKITIVENIENKQ